MLEIFLALCLKSLTKERSNLVMKHRRVTGFTSSLLHEILYKMYVLKAFIYKPQKKVYANI